MPTCSVWKKLSFVARAPGFSGLCSGRFYFVRFALSYRRQTAQTAPESVRNQEKMLLEVISELPGEPLVPQIRPARKDVYFRLSRPLFWEPFWDIVPEEIGNKTIVDLRFLFCRFLTFFVLFFRILVWLLADGGDSDFV